ncbi:MAG: murein hydrolase transporter LrgA [Burkholderiales bacterium RIFCSPHIGHO2_12_FULL_69_20]|nr:MAG: murein hydrolase transporter LrgA [Burkholderiales bacterium RIFCSPHIGHO2_12_FULL_69_20]
MTLLHGLALLLLCQSAGEAAARLLHLPLPGPVLGMLALVALLRWPPLRAPAGQAADALLAHLSLLFVPVGVGVMTHLALISQHGLRMAVALLLSTWIGLAVTALVLRALLPAPDTRSGTTKG